MEPLIPPPMESPAERRRRRRRVPDAVRKRASRACDRCKARKNRCVETASGICVRCTEGSHPCRFDRERDGEEEVSGSAATITASTSSTKPENSVAISPERRTNGSLDDDCSPAASVPSEAFMWPRFLSRLRDAFCLDSQPGPDEQDMTRLQTRPSRPASPDTAELRRVRKAVKGFPPREVADFLVSVCIAYGTDVFFYLDQAQFTAELDQFYTCEASPLRLDTGFVCLALAVFALGSQWTAMARPEDSRDENAAARHNFDPGRVFYDQARILIPDLIDRSCIRSVQATFILGVYLMPASAISASYVYMGLALRKALSIGLHQEPDDPALSSEEKEARRRLWWSIYSLERTVTIKLNRPRSIRQDIISARLPRPTSRDKVQRFDNVQHQIANASFVLIIDKLSQPGAWSSTNQQPLPDSDLPRTLQDTKISLKAWKKDLPPSLDLRNINPKSSSYRAVFHLHLNYYFAWIDMGKVSVVTVVRARLRAAFRPGDEPQAISQSIQSSSDACVRAAKKMLDLFDGLCRGGNMARFSFTDFQGCSIATIIVLLAGILDRDAGYEGRVGFGLDCLRRMACGGNATARMGVRFVEALQSITDEARRKLVDAPRDRGTDSAGSAKGGDGYGCWAEWLASTENATIHDSSGDESEPDLEQADESTINVVGVSSWPPALQPSPWEEEAALQLQEMSASRLLPMNDPEVPHGGQGSMDMPASEDAWMPSLAWNDDQTYLMGLTGMDVLDFTSMS
ncbi:Thiamine repressible genes regulatory protein thi1 [Colletotrichum higginsianum IMI 349063]|uniref:Thiamine repressible genes regulatory protein thi1 n=2 Tax=Colletotrichum higginsianum (strain IMI 349063) TaxID=759273 RepID=A0A1B7YWP1_COLHI|nr:Thiamine repressible genes regulatory protein thi1 [Colletotrichum higginsianum IMI 349063]OBR16459.1 Thiamine repressible genes regulatory protein thi1 [Colletotrichum higginsianum IMI 349063]